MTDQDDSAGLRGRAKRRVAARMSFYSHAAIYALVNSGLAVINLTTTPQTLWFLWPLAGWGIGLIMHGLGTFFLLGGGQARAVESEMARMRNSATRRTESTHAARAADDKRPVSQLLPLSVDNTPTGDRAGQSKS